MKDLIIKALNEAYIILEKRIPQTKPDFIEVSIEDIKPLDLPNFMKANNIPPDAYFSSSYEGERSLGSSVYPSLCYDIIVPTTDKDKLKFCKDKFSTIAFKSVFDSLTNNGYKRTGFNSLILRDFKDICIYNMYINKDFDWLVNYYSLSFSFSPEIIKK